MAVYCRTCQTAYSHNVTKRNAPFPYSCPQCNGLLRQTPTKKQPDRYNAASSKKNNEDTNNDD